MGAGASCRVFVWVVLFHELILSLPFFSLSGKG